MPESKHGGNLRELHSRCGHPEQPLLDFSANINPLGPPSWIRQSLWQSMEGIMHYPDPGAECVIEAASSAYQLPRESIVAANGSTEILYLVPRIFGYNRALIPVPSYVDYERVSRLCELKVDHLYLDPERDFRLSFTHLEKCLEEPALVFLGQPNNPTGVSFSPQGLRETAAAHPDSLFLVDEAFADFVPGLERLYRDTPDNVIVLLSLTKFYAVAGLRVGLAVASPYRAEQMFRHLPPWSVNTMAQNFACQALLDSDYHERTRERVPELKHELQLQLGRSGVQVFPSEANYLLCRLPDGGRDAFDLEEELLRKNIAVRTCADYAGLDSSYFRVAVREEMENEHLVSALQEVLAAGTGSAPRAGRRKGDNRSNFPATPALMFQGTSSNAGKSVLAAAMCRILLQEGYSVAPFKAQNMSLNSFVTRDGKEMGRAQVLQAQACKLEPDASMNPVLLKPNTDTGSQVIVMGTPVRNMEVQDYIRYKQEAGRRARMAYDSLAAEHEVIVLEGAGSPAEINLKAHDLTNMSMAAYSRANVFLVGDIDRGGVFASFVGTMALLEQWEKELVSGFIINRFRGKESLLRPAIQETTRLTGKPVLGTVSYISHLGLPEEDSVSFKAAGTGGNRAESGDRVTVACLDLPHISNFTDLDPLSQEPDVALRIVRRPEDLDPVPDVLILPGSKNVMGDLKHLFSSGLARAIRNLVSGGRTFVVGICGGFQMLGETVADPHGLESRQGETGSGLSILPLITELSRDKTLNQSWAWHLDSDCRLKGYEIHHGRTYITGDTAVSAIRSDAGEIIGYADPARRVWGTYLHGVFDADAFRRWFLDGLREAKGLQPLKQPQIRYDLEESLDSLAEVVRGSLDMDAILSLLRRRNK